MTFCHMAVQALCCLEFILHSSQYKSPISISLTFSAPQKAFPPSSSFALFCDPWPSSTFLFPGLKYPLSPAHRTVLIVSNCFSHSLSLSYSSLVIDTVFSLEPCAGGSGMMFLAKLPSTTSFLSNLSITFRVSSEFFDFFSQLYSSACTHTNPCQL